MNRGSSSRLVGCGCRCSLSPFRLAEPRRLDSSLLPSHESLMNRATRARAYIHHSLTLDAYIHLSLSHSRCLSMPPLSKPPPSMPPPSMPASSASLLCTLPAMPASLPALSAPGQRAAHAPNGQHVKSASATSRLGGPRVTPAPRHPWSPARHACHHTPTLPEARRPAVWRRASPRCVPLRLTHISRAEGHAALSPSDELRKAARAERPVRGDPCRRRP